MPKSINRMQGFTVYLVRDIIYATNWQRTALRTVLATYYNIDVIFILRLLRTGINMIQHTHMNAQLVKVRFSPKSYGWKFAQAFIRLTFRRKVRDVQHILRLRKQWEFSSSFVKLKSDVQYNPFHQYGIHGEWLIPNQASKCVILYLHGGGYCLGSLNTHRAFLTYLSDITNACVFHLDYRMAPEHPFPAALKDAVNAYKWLLAQEEDRYIYIAGDSAGGGLALALLLSLRDQHIDLPKGVICFSPWADLTHQGETFQTNQNTDNLLYAPSLPIVAKLYIGDSNPMHPYLSPVFGDYSGLPPIFIQAASSEILLSDSLRIFNKVEVVNGPITLEIWENVFHAWPYTAPFLPEARKALKHVKKFMIGL